MTSCTDTTALGFSIHVHARIKAGTMHQGGVYLVTYSDIRVLVLGVDRAQRLGSGNRSAAVSATCRI
jgi:hypothetical protein